MSKRILIGKIVAAHGIKGFVKILPLCDDLDLLEGKVFTDETGDQSLDITIKSSAGKTLLAEIDGIKDRNTAETLKCSLYVPHEVLPPPAPHEHYVTDLIGLQVYDVVTKQLIGTVRGVDNFGASDLLDIQPLSGLSFYVPFAKQYVSKVDKKAGRVVVQDIEGFQE